MKDQDRAAHASWSPRLLKECYRCSKSEADNSGGYNVIEKIHKPREMEKTNDKF
jgi:hypothetical protein